MYRVSQITTNPYQQQQITLPDGSNFTLTMRFVPMQLGWFVPTLEYSPSDFRLKGLRVTTSPNMLNQWRNLIPFGLGCFSTQDREPTQLEDFVSGASQLFVLTADECVRYAELLADG